MIRPQAPLSQRRVGWQEQSQRDKSRRAQAGSVPLGSQEVASFLNHCCEVGTGSHACPPTPAALHHGWGEARALPCSLGDKAGDTLLPVTLSWAAHSLLGSLGCRAALAYGAGFQTAFGDLGMWVGEAAPLAGQRCQSGSPFPAWCSGFH